MFVVASLLEAFFFPTKESFKDLNKMKGLNNNDFTS